MDNCLIEPEGSFTIALHALCTNEFYWVLQRLIENTAFSQTEMFQI